jgi:hypothetical protein
MSEAEKYSVEAWKRALGEVAGLVIASETKRNAFAAGFNGYPASHAHHTAREAWSRGQHTAVLLGYIAAPVDTLPKGQDGEAGLVRSKGSAVIGEAEQAPKA